MTCEVKIQWCGGWGYGKNAKATEEMILGWFPEGVHVVQMKDPGTTGNFEITVDGELVHSKKTKSQGFFNKADKGQQDVVKQAVEKAASVHKDGVKSTGDITEGLVQAGGGCTIL